MSPEEKIEAAQKLINEARAEIAAKKRSWPEKIEAGMCFGEEDGDKSMWIVCDDLQLVCVSSYKAGIRWGGWRETKTRLRYLGRDLIKIADDAHEPTGAELVGKACRLSLHPLDRPDSGGEDVVVNYDATTGEYYGERGQGGRGNTPGSPDDRPDAGGDRGARKHRLTGIGCNPHLLPESLKKCTPGEVRSTDPLASQERFAAFEAGGW